MKIIGITGGIGAGKSVATNYLLKCGFTVIDADEVAREAVMPGEPALASLARRFGNGILMRSGELDRAALAALAFASESGTKALNEIMHADIGNRIKGKLRAIKDHEQADVPGTILGVKTLTFLSAPLLFEVGLNDLCDEVWLITAPESIRIARAAARDGLSKSEIAVRVSRQMSEDKKRELAQVIIENTGSTTELIDKISKLSKK